MGYFSGSNQPYTSSHTGDANNQIYGAYSGAVNGMKAPGAIQTGGSSNPWGFGNATFNKQSNPYQFNNAGGPSQFTGGYNKTSVSPYQFSNPSALDGQGGLFGQLMGNTNREQLRNQAATGNNMMRNSQLAGTFSPAMMKNTLLDAQQKSQENIGDLGAKTGMDLATQQATFDQNRQNSQASENMNAAKFGAGENQFGYNAGQDQQKNQAAENANWADRGLKTQGMQADENRAVQDQNVKGQQAALQGEQATGQMDQANQQYFLNLLNQYSQNQVTPYATRTAQPSTFSNILGTAAKVGGAFAGA